MNNMKKLILISILVILVTSCTETKNSYSDVSNTSEEVKRLIQYQDYDTLIVLQANDTLFIMNNNTIIKALPETYKTSNSLDTFLLIGLLIILFFFIGLGLGLNEN